MDALQPGKGKLVQLLDFDIKPTEGRPSTNATRCIYNLITCLSSNLTSHGPAERNIKFLLCHR